MRTINSLAELQIGVGLVYLNDGNAEYYEVVMHHPVQERTFVLMRKPDMKLISQHTANLIGRSAWRIDYSQKDVLDYKINYYEQMAKKLREIRNNLTEQNEKRTMSKAEERAHECYPDDDVASIQSRIGFLLGYQQAEKDLKLTWEDMRELHIIFAEIDVDIELCKTNIKTETLGYYQEVLKCFKAQKGERHKDENIGI